MGTLQPFTPQDLVGNLERKWSGADVQLGGYVGVVNAVLPSGRFMVRRSTDVDDSLVEVVAVSPVNYDVGDRVVMLPVLGGETYLIGHDNAGDAFDLRAFTVEGDDPVATDIWSPAINRTMHWHANAGLTSFTAVGMPAPTVSGSVSSFETSAGAHVRIDTTGTIGNQSGALSSFSLVRADWEPKFLAKITTGTSIANARFWVGLFSADPRGGANPAVHMAAFRFDTGADAGFWRCVTGDGSNRTAGYGASAPIASSSAYDLYIDLDTTRARFYVNGVFVNEITTNLPSSTQKMGIVAGVTTLETSTKMMRVNRISLAHK